MKIALLGSRGIPARYSGFETFYEQLAVRLAARGHEVTVYNRSRFLPDAPLLYHGVHLVSLPSIPTKHLDTITHTLLATCHALFHRCDIAYYVIVGNSPLAWILRVKGTRTLLNVDGQDWAREKWSGFARWYQRRCEQIATLVPDVVIADAQVIRQRYRETYRAQTVFVPYGANVHRDEGLEALQRWGLAPRRYVLYVGRLVPENAVDFLIRAFRQVRTDMRLVVVGDAPFTAAYQRQLRAEADARVVFTGYAFEDTYAQLSSHAYLYVQPSGVDGTRPALLDQMGFGNCVLVRNSPANLEVIGDYGATFDAQRREQGLTDALQTLLDDPDRVARLRTRVAQRITEYYNWDWITDFYVDLFHRLRQRQPLLQYDEFLQTRGH